MQLTKALPTNERPAVFLLDRKPFCFQGANQYYLTWKDEAMVDSVFSHAKALGIRVIRQWGHIDRGSLDGSKSNVNDDGTKGGVYFQYWDADAVRPAYNDGRDGLERLDRVLKKASDSGIRLILTLTNNWPDFGGMDQYLIWYGLENHADFYTDERVKQAYKDWATHLITRINSLTGIAYKDDPTIFAWELANQPRTRNLGRFDRGPFADTTVITNWAREMSAHIRALDPSHMISVGDEGMFSSGSEAFHDGRDGVDHDALLALPNIDFGTFHLYPGLWGMAPAWGDRWIDEHIMAARRAGKPTVLEEYGVEVGRSDPSGPITTQWEPREVLYTRWNELMATGGGAATFFWFLAGHDTSIDANYPDYDHFTVYGPASDPTARLLQRQSARLEQGRACALAVGLEPKRPVPRGFVTTSGSQGSGL